MNIWFDVNEECRGIVVLNGMFLTNEGVWKATICSLVIWFSGGAFEKVGIPLALSTVGGVVLLEIVVNCCLCEGAFCVNTVAEDVDSLVISLHISLIKAVVIVEPPCCGASPAIVVVR